MNHAIVTNELTKQFGSLTAVDHLSLQIERGEVFGFLGPNGAGKTTAIRMFLDFLRPTEGSVQIFGIDPRRDAVAVKRRVGYLPGEFSLYPRMTVDAVLQFFISLRDDVDSRRVDELCDRLGVRRDKKIAELSKGNKQKVGLVQALAPKPDLLILDEPTGGIDPLIQKETHDILREYTDDGTTVFLSSHSLAEVQRVADRVGIIRDGALVALETVDSVREMGAREIHIEFADSPPRDVLGTLDGIRDIAINGNALTALHTGSDDELVKTIARYKIKRFLSAEPDLEDVFMTYYGGEQHV